MIDDRIDHTVDMIRARLVCYRFPFAPATTSVPVTETQILMFGLRTLFR
jgi:hypothetical protein